MTVGDLIAQYRKEHGNMSQRKFAAKCGLSNGYISMIEKNLNPQTGNPPEISAVALKAIADAMEMTVNEIARLVDPDTVINTRVAHVNPMEGLGGISVPLAGAFTTYRIEDQVSADNLKFWSDHGDPTTRVLFRGIDNLTDSQREKLLDMARVMYGKDFDEEGNKK